MAKHIGDDTNKDSVADAVCQRNGDEGQEGRNGLTIVIPMNAGYGRHHHYTHNDKGGRSCCAGDSQEDGAEEQSQRKTKKNLPKR